MTSVVERNKKTAEQFFDRVFNRGDMTVVSSLAPDYTYNGQAMTPQSLIGWVNGMRAQIPDLRFTIEDILGEGDKIALRWRMNGTTAARPGGPPVTVVTTGTNIMTFNADGQAVSNYQNGTATFSIGGKSITKTDQLIYSAPAD